MSEDFSDVVVQGVETTGYCWARYKGNADHLISNRLNGALVVWCAIEKWEGYQNWLGDGDPPDSCFLVATKYGRLFRSPCFGIRYRPITNIEELPMAERIPDASD